MKQSEKSDFFNQVYEQYRGQVYRTCCSYLLDEADRKDLFQEIFVKIWSGLDGLRNRYAIKTWI